MHKFPLSLAFLLCTCHGRRVQAPESSGRKADDSSERLAMLLLSSNPPAAFRANLPGSSARPALVDRHSRIGHRLQMPTLEPEIATDKELAWRRVIEYFADEVTINATVLGFTPGGAAMLAEGLSAFLPTSQITPPLNKSLIGTKVPCKILEVDTEEERIVLSNKQAVVKVSETKPFDVDVGQIVSGTVRSVKPFGFFIDVGGLSGLLHISEVSMDHIEDVEDVESKLPINSSVTALVINRDKEKGRVALSTKTLEVEPGDMLRNPKLVFDNAETAALKYQERLEQDKKAREEASQDNIFGLETLSKTDLAPR